MIDVGREFESGRRSSVEAFLVRYLIDGILISHILTKGPRKFNFPSVASNKTCTTI